MGRIFIVRHGQDTDNAEGRLNGQRDTCLSPLGQKQAEAMAENFADKNITTVYSSPLLRTKQTARYILKKIGVKVLFIDEDIIEREFGILTGILRKDILKYATKTITMPNGVFCLEGPGVEKFEDVLIRVKKFLVMVKNLHRDENIVVVTHGDTGKILMAAHYGWSIEEALQKPYLQNAEIVELL